MRSLFSSTTVLTKTAATMGAICAGRKFTATDGVALAIAIGKIEEDGASA